MNSELKVFKLYEKVSSEYRSFDLTRYCFYIGIKNVKTDLTDKEIVDLINVCNQLDSDYINPISLAESLTDAVYIRKYLSLDELKNVPSDELIQLYGCNDLSYLSDYHFSKEESVTDYEK